MIKIGIDIVAIKRIQKILLQHSDIFLKKFLSSQEILLTKHHPQTIAGFWAAKEACSKALGTGIGKDLGFLDIQISKDQRNAPKLTLKEDRLIFFKVSSFSLSITHESEFAIAAVIAQ